MFLPLHAAGIYDGASAECCTNYVVCSYTPTLSALLRAQKSSPSFRRHDTRLGLIAAMEAWDTRFPTLPNVEEEIRNVQDAAERANVSTADSDICIGDAAIVTRVAEVFKSTNMVHVACHGNQDPAHALSSGFCLSDGSFSISRLMDLDLKDAFFAFLSACDTAKGDEQQPDQTLHLAAAMLFVGFRSVVGTMWSVISLYSIRDNQRADQL
jgi:CHAT domain-containing protein